MMKIDQTNSLLKSLLFFLLVTSISLGCAVSMNVPDLVVETEAAPTAPAPTVDPGSIATQQAVPTFTPAPVLTATAPETVPDTSASPSPTLAPLAPGGQVGPAFGTNDLADLYKRLNPGVVSIQVFLGASGFGGQGAGSGFLINDQGHIVTNNHVIMNAQEITVIFFNGVESEAEVIGADDDSDLAVLQVASVPEGIQPLALGDSDLVQVGEWVVAIGNPFGNLGNSMSIGIVSAIGREIPSGAPRYSIPQAIQTDAAINPGNSGGPLINLSGEVIGVNAQIATSGVEANAGVGFAIPSNIVRRVVPVLIEQGVYQWPYLGISGVSVNLPLVRANNLESQFGAYIDGIIPSGPADRAGLRGSQNVNRANGLEVPVGGDVIVEVDGKLIINYGDLLGEIIARKPGDTMRLVIVRDGERREVEVTLDSRP